ncbi:hypothetical protein L1987_02025 [Smallanthus sonchifolius]|uniref:Uncharacterized protein n=1 Tax=Smallanthus sonchifolius TaxID=185202 RepID=A0ACB9K6U8_9ASTR|nr:hypothetical protein L1987_02025 [Smallanthus sonchifolius]
MPLVVRDVDGAGTPPEIFSPSSPVSGIRFHQGHGSSNDVVNSKHKNSKGKEKPKDNFHGNHLLPSRNEVKTKSNI